MFSLHSSNSYSSSFTSLFSICNLIRQLLSLLMVLLIPFPSEDISPYFAKLMKPSSICNISLCSHSFTSCVKAEYVQFWILCYCLKRKGLVHTRMWSMFFSLVSYVEEGYGGLCKAPTIEERRKWKAKMRWRCDQVYAVYWQEERLIFQISREIGKSEWRIISLNECMWCC